MFSLTCVTVSAGSASTNSTPKRWIVPGMWIGSRSQSVTSTMAFLRSPPTVRFSLPLHPARESQKGRARRGDDLGGRRARARQAFEPGEKEAPSRRRPLRVPGEERGAAALGDPEALAQRRRDHLAAEAGTLEHV